MIVHKPNWLATQLRADVPVKLYLGKLEDRDAYYTIAAGKVGSN